MSILIVKNMNHGFGDRAIFEDVSFRLLKGEHVGLIGANGEGKSTFMNIITGKLMPDEGDVQWSNKVRVGYMDQHAKLEKGKTIREVLREAFQYLFDMEIEMNGLYERMGEMSEDEMTKALERTATIQDMLDHNGFYMIDAKVEEVAAGLGLRDVGLDKDVTDLSGGQRTKVLLAKLLLETPDILLLDEPTNYLDEEHIAWLKNYLIGYENAFILISHDIPFLNSVVNVIYHVENRALTRYTGDYDNFMRVYEANKKQLEAAYERQQAEIAKLEDFVARNKARVATTGMARARQKKLDKMDRIELAAEKPKPEFNFKQGRTSGKLIFEARDLVIGYDEPLSKPLNIRMERGQKIALVGETGAGKTTITNLISRFYEPTKGKIFIDGIDISTVDVESLRSQMGIMLQDSFLFASSIKENIRYGKLDATDEEIIQAAKAVNAHNFIEKLEEGYNTNVNERGSRLSLGQRQLIAFARALISDPRILILDEATANIDTETERLVQEGIKKLMEARTSIVIAHRLSTIRDCDKIFVLSHGKIVEEGTHEELLNRKGYYYNLYCAQYSFLKEA